ncbi:hypothetical protein GCM10010532_061290 [Dactylosporangium siamense]|uniref:Uncharacterized protein n=1 Tax=Dactylosporangium siamense TaxID=685454 RepID=A0A919PTT9_9ACTN|nr:hypothetical protein Dsi01nite_081100 [Dactylosporangium siamense]
MPATDASRTGSPSRAASTSRARGSPSPPPAVAYQSVLGAVSAVLILAGVLSPLDLPGVDLANFAGYVRWSAWLVAFAVVLVRTPEPARA